MKEFLRTSTHVHFRLMNFLVILDDCFISDVPIYKGIRCVCVFLYLWNAITLLAINANPTSLLGWQYNRLIRALCVGTWSPLTYCNLYPDTFFIFCLSPYLITPYIWNEKDQMFRWKAKNKFGELSSRSKTKPFYSFFFLTRNKLSHISLKSKKSKIFATKCFKIPICSFTKTQFTNYCKRAKLRFVLVVPFCTRYKSTRYLNYF